MKPEITDSNKFNVIGGQGPIGGQLPMLQKTP